MNCRHNFLGESVCEHCGAYEVDAVIKPLRARVEQLEGMIRKLAHDYEHPSDETYQTTLAAALSMVQGPTSAKP